MDHDPDLLEVAWSAYEAELESLRIICATLSRGSRYTPEELLSEVASRMPGIVSTYDATKGASFRTHVRESAKRYAWKLVTRHCFNKQEQRTRNLADGEDVVGHEQADRDTQDEVQYILEGLDPYHRSLLLLRFMCDFSYDEIAGVLGVGKGTARAHTLRAIELARERT